MLAQFMYGTAQLLFPFCAISPFYQLYEDKGRLFLSVLMPQLWSLMVSTQRLNSRSRDSSTERMVRVTFNSPA